MKTRNFEYKQRNMKIWNEVAPRYHKRWAKGNIGPFQSTQRLVELINPTNGSTVLDLACGTGVVTKEISNKVGKTGFVIGADTSTTAIKIAKQWNKEKSQSRLCKYRCRKI